MKQIWLAAGCFWGAEAYFNQLNGVIATRVGYGQGTTPDPTYRDVCSGLTGYAEICEISYEDTIISLTKILEHFFRIIDPTTLNRQGPDYGEQYRSGIYYRSEGERQVIVDFVASQQLRYSKPIVVEVEALRNFYPAEEYHQQYLAKNPGGYCHVDLNLVAPVERK